MEYKADSLYTLKSYCLYKIEKFEEAQKQADIALAYYPNSDYAYYLLGIIKREINVYNAIDINFERTRINYYESLSYFRYKVIESLNTANSIVFDMTASLSDLCKAIELNNNVAEYYYERGNTLIEIGLMDKALEDFNKSIKLSNYVAEYFFCRAMLYKKTKKTELSLDDFNKAIELDENPIYYANRGYLKREQLNDENGACKDLRKAAKLGLPLANDEICN